MSARDLWREPSPRLNTRLNLHGDATALPIYDVANCEQEASYELCYATIAFRHVSLLPLIPFLASRVSRGLEGGGGGGVRDIFLAGIESLRFDEARFAISASVEPW